MKPKALLFLPYLAPYRVDVLNELASYYNITAIFQFENAPEQNFNQKFLQKKLKINYEVLNNGFNIGTRQIRFGILKLLKKYQPEVLFSSEYGPTSILLSFYIRYGWYNSKLVATTSDNIYMAKNTKWFRRIPRNFVLNSAEGIMVYNEEVKFWYEHHFSHLKVGVCPNIQNPISILTEFNKIKNISNRFKLEYKIDDNDNILLYVGRFHSVKGIDLLLNAFQLAQLKKTKLVLVGSGPDENKIKQFVLDNNLESHILIPGRFEGDQLYAWYQLADFFVLPSLHEPFGAVINEALINKVPVLCSTMAGATYFVKSGYNGYIFDPTDKAEFVLLLKDCFEGNKKICNNENLMIYDFKESVKEYWNINLN